MKNIHNETYALMNNIIILLRNVNRKKIHSINSGCNHPPGHWSGIFSIPSAVVKVYGIIHPC